jgi:hypothetical protein
MHQAESAGNEAIAPKRHRPFLADNHLKLFVISNNAACLQELQ